MIRLAGISAAVHGVVTDGGQRSVGESIDVPKSTLAGWGTDIRSWPADKLLELAASHPAVRAAILDALAGEVSIGHASDAARSSFGVMVSGGKTMAGLATDLADGVLSPTEARTRLPELREHARQVQRLILDAEAVASVGGQVGRS